MRWTWGGNGMIVEWNGFRTLVSTWLILDPEGHNHTDPRRRVMGRMRSGMSDSEPGRPRLRGIGSLSGRCQGSEKSTYFKALWVKPNCGNTISTKCQSHAHMWCAVWQDFAELLLFLQTEELDPMLIKQGYKSLVSHPGYYTQFLMLTSGSGHWLNITTQARVQESGCGGSNPTIPGCAPRRIRTGLFWIWCLSLYNSRKKSFFK